MLEALLRGDAVACVLPRGYAKLKDQLQRALQGAFLQFVEGVARDGADRKSASALHAQKLAKLLRISMPRIHLSARGSGAGSGLRPRLGLGQGELRDKEARDPSYRPRLVSGS